jgi:pimeloyl-ACP methyl ester carboxylesterase
MNIRPFNIQVSEGDIADLRQRIARTRWPDQYEGGGWELGAERGYLQELAAYWADGFDFGTCLGELSWLPQFMANIGDREVHFVHARSAQPDALPLIITHGWPGTFAEMAKIIPMLTDPERHGRDPRDAFHVVAPSIPGFGFSGKPVRPGTTPGAIAALWVKLMNGLGYDRFCVQGGDFGSTISVWLAHDHPENVLRFHLNMIPPSMRPAEASLARKPLTASEQDLMKRGAQFQEAEGAYAHIHRTKPQTLGHALQDSPVGLAAWIAEKFRSWSDCGGVIENAISRDELLTNISIYWFTGTITSSMRLYRERVREPMVFDQKLKPPFGFANFPKEPLPATRDFAERFFDVQQWTDMPRGGHFAALEQPELLADDLRKFFRPLRK